MSSSVIEAFKKLNMSGSSDFGDHDAVFEVSYQYLSKVKKFTDINAFHNCIVSLINLDKYYRALQLIEEVSLEIHGEFPVEKAYVYYKTGHNSRLKALYEETLGSENAESRSISARALKHVMAQSLYQNGQISEALALYKELIISNKVDNELDMACNERAILSQLASKEKIHEAPVLNVSAMETSYDLVFNNALLELTKGNISSALSLLEQASVACIEQNMDSHPADLALEIAPIKLTSAYIHQIQGNTKQAMSVLNNIDMDGVIDLMTMLTFRNNYISLTGTPENINFSSRELNYKDNLHHLRHKLTKSQFQTLTKNILLLSYQSGTLPRTSNYFRSKFYNQYAEDFKGDVTPLLYKVLLKLQVSMRDLQSVTKVPQLSRKLYKFCLQRVEALLLDDETVAATLLLVHLNSQAGKYEQSILILEKIVTSELEAAPELLHASLCGTLINTYEISNNSKKLQDFYQTLLTKFSGLSTTTLSIHKPLYKFVRAYAFKLLTGDSASEVTPILRVLQQANPTDALVSSVLTGDHSNLVPAEELASTEEVETLLAVKIENIVNGKSMDLTSSTDKPITVYKVTKKHQKPKFSKNKTIKPASDFKPEKDLDQERWLPMKLRSYFKPSKKESKKKTGSHQGAMESSPTPGIQPSGTTSISSKSKNKSKQKKKKGKK